MKRVPDDCYLVKGYTKLKKYVPDSKRLYDKSPIVAKIKKKKTESPYNIVILCEEMHYMVKRRKRMHR